ncbi:MAG TPA: S41 family peptidase [Steroidobacteraceae bacterium]|nr:S41 family peptidase [Steroidobacteraceae bacterium]
MNFYSIRLPVAGLLVPLLLAACGGGGDSGGTVATATGSSTAASSGGSSGPTYVPGQYLPAANFAAKCASPRSGTDPVTNVPYPDVQGTGTDENYFLRSWTHQLYLWFADVPDLDPAQYSTADYFPLLKTSATTASGAPVDRFHFTYATSVWESLSQEGEQAGYGVDFEVIAATPPRQIVVAYLDPSASGAAATLARGTLIESIDGVDAVNDDTSSGVATLNAGLQPSAAGQTHTFTVLDPGSSTPRTVQLLSTNVTQTPVPVATAVTANGGKVGYILFNDHIATAEAELISAFTSLQSQGVSDLVLDIRYNGGGYLDIASEVAYMIAGAAQTGGRTFELQQFNSQYPSLNPVTNATITPTLFHSTSQGFSVPSGQALPSLNLSRVFILTGTQTCSASESIINSLRGVNVQVILVGSTTCGKPYGFYPQDNCGTTYFSIQLRGVNDQGFGDYPAGFSPGNTLDPAGVVIPGCSVADDFSHALGDPAEAQFSEALAYRSGSVCTVQPSGSGIKLQTRPQGTGLAVTARSPLRDIKILRE